MKVKIYTFWPRKWTSRPKISAIRHQFHQNRVKIDEVRAFEKTTYKIADLISFCNLAQFLTFAFFNRFWWNWCLIALILGRGVHFWGQNALIFCPSTKSGFRPQKNRILRENLLFRIFRRTFSESGDPMEAKNVENSALVFQLWFQWFRHGVIRQWIENE